MNKIFAALSVGAILMGCQPGTSIVPGSAAPIEPMGELSEGRDEHAVFILEDSVVVAGGRGRYEPITTVERLEIASAEWSEIGELPEARAGGCYATYDDTLFIAAGRGPDETPATSVFLSEDGGESWTAFGELPSAHANPRCALVDDSLYVIGGRGTNGRPTDLLSIVNLRDRSVSNGPNMLLARADHSVATLRDGRVVVVGGEGESGLLESGEVFDPNSTTWTRTQTLRTPRINAVPLDWDERTCVAAGQGEGFLESIECLDPHRLTWEVSGRLGDTRAQASIIPVGDELLVVGGGRPVRQRDAIVEAEILQGDGSEDSWQPLARLRYGRMNATTHQLTDGRWIVIGGRSSRGRPMREVEVFDISD